MSEFEFISVLISMVVGLGVTHVLRGFAQVVHERKQAPVDGIHMVWTAVVTLNLQQLGDPTVTAALAVFLTALVVLAAVPLGLVWRRWIVESS